MEPLGRPAHSLYIAIYCLDRTGAEVTFLCSIIFSIFPNDQNSGYLYDFKFIFGRCHLSWAAETPGKREHDWNDLTYTFAKSKFPVKEKLSELQ